MAGTAELNRGDSTRGATGRRGKKSTVVHRWGFRDRIICAPDYLFAGAINVVPAAKNLSIRVSVGVCLLTKYSFVYPIINGYHLLSWLATYLFTDLSIYYLITCTHASLW